MSTDWPKEWGPKCPQGTRTFYLFPTQPFLKTKSSHTASSYPPSNHSKKRKITSASPLLVTNSIMRETHSPPIPSSPLSRFSSTALFPPTALCSRPLTYKSFTTLHHLNNMSIRAYPLYLYPRRQSKSMTSSRLHIMGMHA